MNNFDKHIECLMFNRFGTNRPIKQRYESGPLGNHETFNFQNLSMVGSLPNPIHIDIPNWNGVNTRL